MFVSKLNFQLQIKTRESLPKVAMYSDNLYLFLETEKLRLWQILTLNPSLNNHLLNLIDNWYPPINRSDFLEKQNNLISSKTFYIDKLLFFA